jgi:hypothetical protein
VDYIAEKLTEKNDSIPSRLMAKVLTETGLPFGGSLFVSHFEINTQNENVNT